MTHYEPDAPWETHLMSFLEDMGLVKVVDGPTDFKLGMFDYGFILPDWIINVIVVMTVLYWMFTVN